MAGPAMTFEETAHTDQQRKRAEEDRLAAIGWPEYQPVLLAAENAAHAYDRACEAAISVGRLRREGDIILVQASTAEMIARHTKEAVISAADFHRASAQHSRACAALKEARLHYPLAAEYAKAVAYSESRDYLQAAAGRRAMEAIQQGADPDEAVARMVDEWREIRDYRD